jgi:tetratricopeptide (TPR) repeat protein
MREKWIYSWRNTVDIKYSKKKQEMRKDPVFEFIMQAKDVVVAQSNTIIMITLAAALVLGGVMVFGSIKKSGLQKAQEAFGKALLQYEISAINLPTAADGNLSKAVDAFKTVADNFKGSPQATYSAYLIGHIFLKQQRYDEAITWFNAAASKNSRTDFVGASALEGLATCYEAKGNSEEALTYLKKALQDDRLRYRSPAIAWKSALICKDLKKIGDAKSYCQKIIADTVSIATPFKQKAENMIVELSIQEKS